MAITDKIRRAFDECTVMAGVENDFECVYITKAAALLYLDEVDTEVAKLRELVRDLWARRDSLLDFGFYAEVAEQLDELGIEV